MVRCVRSWCCALAFALTSLVSLPASAASWLELNFWLEGPRYDGVLPACDHRAALSKISARFAEKESTFWNSKVAIVDFTHIRETAAHPWDRDLIPRRFCAARAHLSTGKWRPVYYLIGEAHGIIGASWGVEWCVVGYDRNWAYHPACKMARP